LFRPDVQQGHFLRKTERRRRSLLRLTFVVASSAG
jgi:hypothetical protein